MHWEVNIGLEVHVQLKTNSKLFSGASVAYGAKPNANACLVDFGAPGTMPVLNTKAVEMAVKFGLAINAEIAEIAMFDRKNYFYPDLPKGYQITQYFAPILKNGYLDILQENGNYKRVHIVRAHLEEDTGKLLHIDSATGIDLNRAGIPLLEIVSSADINSAKEAVSYLKALHILVRYLEISDANMHEGSFRCDVNVSIRPQGATTLGTRAEIKNINSFRFIEFAIDHELKRQITILERGDRVEQETRLFDSKQKITKLMRNKEDSSDYRYFPDPDLLPLRLTSEYVGAIKETLSKLPKLW